MIAETEDDLIKRLNECVCLCGVCDFDMCVKMKQLVPLTVDRNCLRDHILSAVN